MFDYLNWKKGIHHFFLFKEESPILVWTNTVLEDFNVFWLTSTQKKKWDLTVFKTIFQIVSSFYSFIFSLSSEKNVFKGEKKQNPCIEKCILICFFFSPLKTFSQKILKIWTNKKMKQIEKLFWTMSNLISLFWVEVNQKII